MNYAIKRQTRTETDMARALPLAKTSDDMFNNKLRKNNRRRISVVDICDEVKSLRSGEVLIVKTAPGIPTLDLSVKSTLLSDNPEGRKILFHSMKTIDAEVAERLMDIRKRRKDPDQEQIHLNDEPEFNVYKELSAVRPDLYVIDYAEAIGARAQNSDELAHDLLVYYAAKFNTAIVAFVRSRTELSGGAEYEYDLYGQEMVLDIERTPLRSFLYPDPAYYCGNYYGRKIASMYSDRDYYKEFRRILSRFIKFIELDDGIVRKSIKGYCFESIYALNEELDSFESAHRDEIPLHTRLFVEQMHTQMEFFGDRSGCFRTYFGLGAKQESFRDAMLLSSSYFNLKSSISNICHLFISVAGSYLKELRSRGIITKDSAKF